MKTRLFIFSIAILLISVQKTTAQKPKMVDDNYIYMNSDGTQSFPGTFYIAEKFSGNFAAVASKMNGEVKWAYINKSGQLITEYLFDDAKPFKKNMAIVTISKCLGMIDSTGKLFIPAEYSSLSEFQNGFAIFNKCSNANESGYLRMDGSSLLNFTVNKAFPFENNLARIEKKDPLSNNTKMALVDTSGKIIDNRWFLSVGEIYKDSCLVATEDGTFWFHLDGRMIKISDDTHVLSCDEIFTIVEDQPSYPGGEQALMDYLSSNIKYPQLARESNIQGTVFVSFTVTSYGLITNVKVLRGIGGGCDEESMRVVRNMPPWNPGRQRGNPVCVQFNLPIRFVLSDGSNTNK
ncbi:hypothetical protein SDC9_65300 [bioreactor metagenome]|uniref:TonB C-terminal domain-containing protein n=1 Tax=bioreactor metagenome TaxID=1076179 RepID=A0A644XRM2_9ZZZZ